MNTQKAENILNFIKDYIEREHMSPSVRDIREGLGIKSTSTIHRYLHLLEAQEKIYMSAHRNRSIVLREDIVTGIPLVTPAHFTEATEEEAVTEYIRYTPYQPVNGSLFAIRTEKDIPEAGILCNDILIAEQSETFEEQNTILYLDSEQQISVTNETVPETAFGTLLSLIRDFNRKEEASDD